MRFGRMGLALIVVMVLVVAYFAIMGYATPVKDFDQPTDTTPTGTYGFTWNSTSPPGTYPVIPDSPVVWKSINFDFQITNLGILDTPSGTDFLPDLRVDSFTDDQAFYTGMSEGRIYKNQPLSINWGNTPSIPDSRSWFVHVDVTGYGGNYDFRASWDDTTAHTASFSAFEISGSTGRVFTSESGTYNAHLILEDTVNGAIYGGAELIFVVEAYSGTIGG